MKHAILFILFTYVAIPLFSQKSVLDTSVFTQWTTVANPAISHDGKFMLYMIRDQANAGGRLIVLTPGEDWVREFPGVDRAAFTADSKYAIFRTNTDSLGILRLGGEPIRYLTDVDSFELPEKGKGEWLVFYPHENDTANAGQPEHGKTLRLYNLLYNRIDTFPKTYSYYFSSTGAYLLVQTQSKDQLLPRKLNWVKVSTGEVKDIWNGNKVFDCITDQKDSQAYVLESSSTFNSSNYSISKYTNGQPKAVPWINNFSEGMKPGVIKITELPISLSRDEKRIFFYIRESDHHTTPEGTMVDVYGYRDKVLQSFQQANPEPRAYLAMATLEDKQVSLLDSENISMLEGPPLPFRQYDHFMQLRAYSNEYWQAGAILPSYYLLDTRSGTRQLLKDSVTNSWPDRQGQLSPHEKWFVWYDHDHQHYFSLDLSTQNRLIISKDIHVSLMDMATTDRGKVERFPAGIGGWMTRDFAVFLYDGYDIWQVDPSTHRDPINITHGYGRSHHIRFRLLLTDSQRVEGIQPGSTLRLTAFDEQTKENGYFSVQLGEKDEPQLLNMEKGMQYVINSQVGPFNVPERFAPLKARDANIWIVGRSSASVAPNYFITRDFREFQAISDNHPETGYNWLTSELVHWQLPDGNQSEGILYKPENFNTAHKYPLLFVCYEKGSDDLNYFWKPEPAYGPINIPWFVSRGYLVFVPDITYRMGHPGESALDAIVSAAKFLTRNSWVNSQRMGIYGHSFGGYETNYIITHSHLMAAAAEASGFTDLVSSYDELQHDGSSNQTYYEFGQGRIGATLWQRPDLYLEGSPVMKANEVTTPLLMLHNKGDKTVPFGQAVELFTGLRRLGKKVWMLQYDGEDHRLWDMKNRIDYNTRLTQFFDYYLKDGPAPRWMTEGIPARMKGVDSGLEPAPAGAKP